MQKLQLKKTKKIKQSKEMAQLAPLAVPIIAELGKIAMLERNSANEQQMFNENICRTVRDNHSDLLNRHTTLGTEVMEEKARFSAEMARMCSKQDSLKDLMETNERATRHAFDMAAVRLNDAQNNHDKNITLLQNHQNATSSRLNLVSDKYHELDKQVALRDRDNKTALNKAFDQINTVEQYRVGDLERFDRLEEKHRDIDKRMALRDRDYETAFSRTLDRLSTVEKHRAEDLQRFNRVEDCQRDFSSEIILAKVATAELKSRQELTASQSMMLVDKYDELNKAVVFNDRDNKMAIEKAHNHITAMEKYRTSDLERFGGLEGKHCALEKSVALRDKAYETAFNKTNDRLKTMEKYRAGDIERFGQLENKHDELEKYVARKDSHYETIFNKTSEHFGTLEKLRAGDLKRFGGLKDKQNELEKLVAHNDGDYKTAFNKTFDRLNTLEKYRASELEKFEQVKYRQQELSSEMASSRKATDELTVRFELNTRENIMAMDNFKNQISNVDRNVATFERQFERLSDDTKAIYQETMKGQKDTAFVKHQIEQKAEEDKKIISEIGARVRQVETHSDSALKKAENIQREQEQLKNEIKAMGDKFKEYLAIGTVVGAFIFFSLKRGN